MKTLRAAGLYLVLTIVLTWPLVAGSFTLADWGSRRPVSSSQR